jgi:hypothetical protein
VSVLDDIRKVEGVSTNGHNGSVFTTRPVPVVLPEDEVKTVDPADVATIDDLRKAGASVSWVWEGWIPEAVLTAIAAVGGTGKTRFCADLLRRIRRRMPWPDGTLMHLPADTLALWVVADNQHDELVTLAERFGIEDNIRLNALKSDPYGGVTLDEPDDYQQLEARIKAVRPRLVIVDTVGNATDRNLSKQEDAKAFYWPLQIIARRYRCAILCLTHLNATGQFLGRRVLEKVRVALRMTQFEGEERRRLEVHKSNAKKPAALGVTMGDDGNDYDPNPPEPPVLEPGKTGQTGRVKEAAEWLRGQLAGCQMRVSHLIDQAKEKGISVGTLYRAKEVLGIGESETEGRKWWGLVNSELPE